MDSSCDLSLETIHESDIRMVLMNVNIDGACDGNLCRRKRNDTCPLKN